MMNIREDDEENLFRLGREKKSFSIYREAYLNMHCQRWHTNVVELRYVFYHDT